MDGALPVATASEIMYRVIYLMVEDIVRNGASVSFPLVCGNAPVLSLTQMEENDFEALYREPKGLDDMDYFSSMHKAYHLTMKRAGMDFYPHVDLDNDTFNRIIEKVSTGTCYNRIFIEREWKVYVRMITRYYKELSYIKLNSIVNSGLRAIYKISQSDDELTISDKDGFSISFGNIREVVDDVNIKIPNFITFPEFDKVYYIPVKYKTALTMNTMRFNIFHDVFITTSLEYAKMKSRYIIKAYVNKDYGNNTVVDTLKFNDFTIISRERGFRKESLRVKYLSNPTL